MFENNAGMCMRSMVDFSNREIIQSLAALCKFIKKNRILDQLPEFIEETNNNNLGLISMQPLYIQDLRNIPNLNVMQIDRQSCNALSIFVTEIHPSQKGTNTAKEGLSIFNLCNKHTLSKMGSFELRLILYFYFFYFLGFFV